MTTQQIKLTPPEAFENIKRVVRAHLCNANDRDILNASLDVIAQRINHAAQLDEQQQRAMQEASKRAEVLAINPNIPPIMAAPPGVSPPAPPPGPQGYPAPVPPQAPPQ